MYDLLYFAAITTIAYCDDYGRHEEDYDNEYFNDRANFNSDGSDRYANNDGSERDSDYGHDVEDFRDYDHY